MAQTHGTAPLFKGADFTLTDIRAAAGLKARFESHEIEHFSTEARILGAQATAFE